MRKFFCLLITSLILTTTAQAKDLRFAQISDLRFSNAIENTRFQNVIQDINKQKDIEFVVFTGDNIAKPTEKDLKAFLKELKKLKHPFYIVIGDKEVNKLKHFGKADYIKTIKKDFRKYKIETTNYSFEKDGMIFIVADGAKEVIPSSSGYFKEETLNWLDSELAKYPENNIVIFQHFPIIPPNQKETYYTFKPETYLAVVSKYPNIKAIISGHFGVNSEKTLNGISHITTAEFPYYRVIDVLDYDTKTPTIWAQLKQAK